MPSSERAAHERQGGEIALDAFPSSPVGSSSRSGDSIRGPQSHGDSAPEYERLEKAVLELAGRYARLRREHASLASTLRASERRVAELEAELRQGNQLRSDVAKRIDDLVGQIDQIEDRFTARGA